MLSLFFLHLQRNTALSYYKDPIEARPLDGHLAMTKQADVRGFQLYLPDGQLCDKDGITSGSIVNVLCDLSDSEEVHCRFGTELMEARAGPSLTSTWLLDAQIPKRRPSQSHPLVVGKAR